VHVLATCVCRLDSIPGATIHPLSVVPHKQQRDRSGLKQSSAIRFDRSGLVGRVAGWAWDTYGLPLRCLALAPTTRVMIGCLKPDLVHALRIPIEGELGHLSGFRPLVVSVWGNDFTLYANRSLAHRYLTRKTIASISGLIADCGKDIVRARENGLRSDCPTTVLPGGGGIRSAWFVPGPYRTTICSDLRLEPGRQVILNPRRYTRYVRNDTFFEAIPKVLASYPQAVFVGVGLSGCRMAEDTIRQRGISSSVILTPVLTQDQLADLFRASCIFVSPTEHDGTPNSLLEGMACGSFPMCGDLPSIREWISPGYNGILFDPGNPADLANSICSALQDPTLRDSAAEYNRRIVCDRAEYGSCMQRAEEFYFEVVDARSVKNLSRET
jgi:glycosyltransferase involved in cell wall biosynthesis